MTQIERVQHDITASVNPGPLLRRRKEQAQFFLGVQ